MQKWEYMWIYLAKEKRKQIYIANGERLNAGTYAEALNVVGQDGWELVSVIPPTSIRRANFEFPQFCLKRPVGG